MYKVEISSHLLRIIEYMQSKNAWVTSREVADKAGVSRTTAVHQMRRLADLDIANVQRLYPEYLYRLSEKAQQQPVWFKIQEAREAMSSVGDGSQKMFPQDSVTKVNLSHEQRQNQQ